MLFLIAVLGCVTPESSTNTNVHGTENPANGQNTMQGGSEQMGQPGQVGQPGEMGQMGQPGQIGPNGQQGGVDGQNMQIGPGGQGPAGGSIGDPNDGHSIGSPVPPEDGQNIGDPNIPPDTINQQGNADGNMGNPGQEGQGGMNGPSATDGAVGQQEQPGQREPSKKPPSFIFNAQSEDSGPIYKAEDGSCFVRKDWNQPPNGVMGAVETRDCPAQMQAEAWKACTGGRLVKHNVGDREGTCMCEPVVGEPSQVTCP
jgi:hypothetical protein